MGRNNDTEEPLTLADLPRVGCRGRVLALHGHGPELERLRALGFCPGTEVTFRLHAPLRDPLCFEIRGSELCLRRRDARRILVETLEGPPA